MYLQCKFGFVEADRWDGTPIVEKKHAKAIARISGPVVVVRSRKSITLVGLRSLLIGAIRADIQVLDSPKGWDYEFRMYLSATEWGDILAGIAHGLDYRNFKSWTKANAPEQVELAHDIWEVANK